MRAASCTAFTVLAYVVLWEVVRRLKKSGQLSNGSATLLRLQPAIKRDDPSDGNAAIYAISQALEKALSREIPFKLQGYVTEPDVGNWRQRGALGALGSAFPLAMSLSPAALADKVALISYATRPCDSHPLQPDADGFLYLSRTYLGERRDGWLHVRVDRMHSRFVGSQKDFDQPRLVLEEIARVREAGYRHVLLLSHHFGNQRIGRAAERHAPHCTFQFLEEAAARFSDVFVYPLRRDVFPATRLQRRGASESGFEVLNYGEHAEMLDGHRHVLPIYTFATLAVVGDETERPQSGFCTYFLDVEQRLKNAERAELMRQRILGIGDQHQERDLFIALLRSLHYLESEKWPTRHQVLPVLDPFDWAAPGSVGQAGELEVAERRRRKGGVVLSFPAVLAHVTKVLHREVE
jgi:hypothetical protein